MSGPENVGRQRTDLSSALADDFRIFLTAAARRIRSQLCRFRLDDGVGTMRFKTREAEREHHPFPFRSRPLRLDPDYPSTPVAE